MHRKLIRSIAILTLLSSAVIVGVEGLPNLINGQIVHAEETISKFESKGGSEYEEGTFRLSLKVGESGQIRRPQASPLKDFNYSFEIKVDDPSILSFDSQGNWIAHKVGTTKVYPSFPTENSEQIKKFEEELALNPVELYIEEDPVVWEVTVEEVSEKELESSETLSEPTESSTEPSVSEPSTDQVDGLDEPTMIFGSDDRLPIKDTTLNPYRKVVAVYVHRNGRIEWNGSGVMIAPNKVLTAAHVVRNVRTNKTYDEVTVIPGQNGNHYPYNQATGSRYHFFTSFLNDTELGYSRVKVIEDMAVVTLDTPIDAVGFLPVTSSLALNEDIVVIGYPYDKNMIMHISGGKVKSIDGKTIKYRNDMLPGNSGGPVLDSQNRIVAVNIAEPKVEGQYTFDYWQKYGANTGRKIDQDALRLIDIALHNKQTGNGISASVPTYRLYNSGLKYHLYTKDKNEVGVLSSRGWTYEGVSWRTDTSGTPIYRLYHSGIKKHLLTKDVKERDNLVSSGWKGEGVIFYSSGQRPVYRLYNSVLKVHLFTSDKNEYNVLATRGWKQEGIAWNVE